jgi:hypothetical protein
VGAEVSWGEADARRGGREDRNRYGVLEDEQGRELRFVLTTALPGQVSPDIIENVAWPCPAGYIDDRLAVDRHRQGASDERPPPPAWADRPIRSVLDPGSRVTSLARDVSYRHHQSTSATPACREPVLDDGDLYRAGRVIDEVDEKRYADEDRPDGHRDRHTLDERLLGGRLRADHPPDEQGVGGGPAEDAEDDLIRAVCDEVAEDARTVRRRRA